MAAAAILKAVGHCWFCIFEINRMSRTCLSNVKMAAAAIWEIQVHAIKWAITTRF
jgi:hypothetical protein